MKVTNTTSPSFQPVTLQFTFETKEELDAFGTLFNITPVAVCLRKAKADISHTIYTAVDGAGGDIMMKHDEMVQNLREYFQRPAHH